MVVVICVSVSMLRRETKHINNIIIHNSNDRDDDDDNGDVSYS